MATTDEILGVNRLPNENTKKLMAKKLETDTGAVTLMSEICLKVNNAKDKSKKLRVLRENDSQALRQILKGAFDPKIKWSLPLEGGPIPYKPNDAPAGTEHTSLRQEVRHFYNFIQGGNPSLSKTRREAIFIQILETLHPDEAQLLVTVKDKCLEDFYNITQQTVSEAYPDITWGGRGGQQYQG